MGWILCYQVEFKWWVFISGNNWHYAQFSAIDRNWHDARFSFIGRQLCSARGSLLLVRINVICCTRFPSTDRNWRGTGFSILGRNWLGARGSLLLAEIGVMPDFLLLELTWCMRFSIIHILAGIDLVPGSLLLAGTEVVHGSWIDAVQAVPCYYQQLTLCTVFYFWHELTRCTRFFIVGSNCCGTRFSIVGRKLSVALWCSLYLQGWRGAAVLYY